MINYNIDIAPYKRKHILSVLLQNRIRRSSCNRYGKRTERLVTFNDGQKRKSEWVYDKYGRLTAMNDESKTVSYTYDNQSRISVRKADNIPVYYTYTRFGQLETKSLGSPFAGMTGAADSKPIAYIKYFYSPDGQITARDVSGNKQDYKYDLKGQLLEVVDSSGKAVEQYVYDAAGNILSKSIDGKVTTFKYDKANQLVSSADATGKITHYEYDAAGRLTREGDKSYAYGWLDKVVNVSENGKLAASYDYGVDGQISGRTDASGKSESFTWDGLALIKRDSTNFVNESAVTGGNPILAFGKDSSKVLFEDMLGSTVGSVEAGKFNAISRTAFGELESGDSSVDFFTGKPQVSGLGYSFLFRNYRSGQGKWQTQDPIGYLGGWNNLAYVNNHVISSIDWQGTTEVSGGTEIRERVTAGQTKYLTDWVAVGSPITTPGGNTVQEYECSVETYDLVEEYEVTKYYDSTWRALTDVEKIALGAGASGIVAGLTTKTTVGGVVGTIVGGVVVYFICTWNSPDPTREVWGTSPINTFERNVRYDYAIKYVIIE